MCLQIKICSTLLAHAEAGGRACGWARSACALNLPRLTICWHRRGNAGAQQSRRPERCIKGPPTGPSRSCPRCPAARHHPRARTATTLHAPMQHPMQTDPPHNLLGWLCRRKTRRRRHRSTEDAICRAYQLVRMLSLATPLPDRNAVTLSASSFWPHSTALTPDQSSTAGSCARGDTTRVNHRQTCGKPHAPAGLRKSPTAVPTRCVKTSSAACGDLCTVVLGRHQEGQRASPYDTLSAQAAAPPAGAPPHKSSCGVALGARRSIKHCCAHRPGAGAPWQTHLARSPGQTRSTR